MDQKQDAASLVDVREHVLYCGVTQTGKTTLARLHARLLSRANYDVAVYDPVMTETAGGGWPEKAKIVGTEEEFQKLIERPDADEDHPLFLFVDEGADLFGHGQTHNHWVPRKIRHAYVYLRIIAQRPHMLHPSVRSQCAYCYKLRLSAQDSRLICADYGHSADVSEISLDKGDCLLLVSGSSEIEEFNVFELVDRSSQRAKKGTS